MANGWGFGKTPSITSAYQSPNRRLSQMLMQRQMGQPRQQRRGNTGQIVDFLQSGLGAYLMQKDMGQQQAAQQAFATGAKGGDLKGAMTALEGLSGNPYAQNRLQNLLMRQIGQSQKEKQRLKELGSERETYKFQQEHKAFPPTKLVPGRDIPYAPGVQEQRLKERQAKKTSWSPVPGEPGLQVSTSGEKRAMPQTSEQKFKEKIELQKASAALKPMTVNQANAGLYSDRMKIADAIVSDPSIMAAGMSWGEAAKAGVPGIGNVLASPQYQQFEQSRRDFINATLRRESGAAIAETEFDSANKQYFPQKGDSQEVIAQKAKNRQTAIEGIARAAGPQYQAAQMPQPAVGMAQPVMTQPPLSIAGQELSMPPLAGYQPQETPAMVMPPGFQMPPGVRGQVSDPNLMSMYAPLMPGGLPPSAAPQEQLPDEGRVQVQSLDEAKQLPPGTRILTPDGRRMTMK